MNDYWIFETESIHVRKADNGYIITWTGDQVSRMTDQHFPINRYRVAGMWDLDQAIRDLCPDWFEKPVVESVG